MVFMQNPHVTKANKYIAIAATTKKVAENPNGFSMFFTELTNKAITRLAETAKDKPVLINFNEEQQVGVVTYGCNESGNLIIFFNTKDDFYICNFERLVPSYIVDFDSWHEEKGIVCRTIHKVRSISYGLTIKPIKTDLPRINKYYE